MKRLTKYEKENIFLSNAAEDYWSVYINSKPFKRRFKEYDDKYAGILIHEHTDQYGGELYKVPKNCISIRLLPPRTDEQKKKAKEHAIKCWSRKKSGVIN